MSAPVSKCPSCWTENDEGVCEFDTSATDCFTQTCTNGAMQLSINFRNLFNSAESDLGEYNSEIGVDNENWPSSRVKNLYSAKLSIYLILNLNQNSTFVLTQ